MSVFSAIFDSRIYNFEQAFGVKDSTSRDMRAALRDWNDLYYNREPTKDEDPCQRLPVAIVSKLTKTTFSEYAATSDNAFASEVLDALDKIRKKAMQNALIGGECFLKPIFTGAGMCFTSIERQNFLVFGRNEMDEITDIGTAERTVVGKYRYTLLERRHVNHAGYLTIESGLYRSESEQTLGVEVPLDTLDKYAMLIPVNVLPKPVWSIGLISVKTPLENCVDGSPDSVSVYAPAAGLIHLINTNEAQINGEFERGKSRLLTDEVFTSVDEDPESIGVTIFSPAFREQSFLARKTEYLRNIESLIGLKRGLLSEVEAAERTATEVTSSAGDYNLTIIDFQEMWTAAVKEAVRVCGILGQMYKAKGATVVDPDKDVTIDWGNGILYDEDKTWADYMAMVASGMLKPEIALAWKFNLPWDTPEEIEAIRQKYMPEIESMTERDGDE